MNMKKLTAKERLALLEKEPRLTYYGEIYKKDLSETLNSLCLKFSEELPYKIDRKMLGAAFKSIGMGRTKEENNVAKSFTKHAVNLKNGRKKELEKAQERLVEQYGSLENMFQKLNDEEISKNSIVREAKISLDYLEYFLKDSGVVLKSRYNYNYQIIAQELSSIGWTEKKIRKKYCEDNLSTRQIIEEISVDFPMTRRIFQKILTHYEIRKTTEQIRHLQGSRQRAIEKDIDRNLASTGFTPEILAKIYDNNYGESYGSLTKLVNGRLPKDKKISEKSIHSRVAPFVTRTSKSLTEDQFFRALEEKFSAIKIERNNRKILKGKEIDFVLEDPKVAIEFNGDYWHSDRFIIENHGMPAVDYHRKKRNAAKRKGYRLFFVWESDWRQNSELVMKELERVIAGGRAGKLLTRLGNTVGLVEKLRPLLEKDLVAEEKDLYRCGKVLFRESALGDSPLKLARAATEANETLIQIYPWDDLEKIARLINFRNSPADQKVSARKLEFKKISKKETNEFLKENHIQGARRGLEWAGGLFSKDGELLAVGTFGKPAKRVAQWEFQRYAVRGSTIVFGGAGAIFKKFLEEVEPKTVVSYLDYSHTTKKETFLDSIGFREVRSVGGKDWWREADQKLVKGSALIRLGADALLRTSYGPIEKCGLNNEEIMEAEGFLPYKTAGNRVFNWRAPAIV